MHKPIDPSVFEFMMDPVVLTDLEGRMTAFNKAFTDTWGWGNEAIGKLPTDLVVKGDVPRLVEVIKEVNKKGYVRDFECTMLTKDNKEIPITVNITLLKDPEGNPTGHLAVARDITKLKKAEEDRVKAVSTVFDAMGDGVILFTLDGEIINLNPAYEELTGYKRNELVGKQIAEFVPKWFKGEDTERASAVLKTALGGKVPGPVPLTMISEDGRETPMSFTLSFMKGARGKPTAVVVAVRDTTERVQTEEALQRHIKELEGRDELISKLATPIVEVWERIAMLPLIGFLDSARARQITESVLKHIARAKTEVIVMDISGIAAIDTKSASHILRTVQAVRLMGSEVIITGIRPDVATTLVTLGLDLTGIETRSTLREGLEYAYARLGWKVTKVSTT